MNTDEHRKKVGGSRLTADRSGKTIPTQTFWSSGTLALAVKILIAADALALSLNFLSSHVGLDIPAPGRRLNNPLAILLALLFALGYVDRAWGDKWLARLKNFICDPPTRYYFFAALVAGVALLETMHYLHPLSLRWDLDKEQGYGTYFATVQLFILGLVVLMVAREDEEARTSKSALWAWRAVMGVYFYLALDDCLGIHENFIKILQPLAPKSAILHVMHEWLWVYAPFILAVAIFLARFFFLKFRGAPKIMFILFAALSLWVSVIFLEGVAKSLVDPQGLFYSTVLESVEEGAEMLGATLFLLGFSAYLRSLPSSRRSIEDRQ